MIILQKSIKIGQYFWKKYNISKLRKSLILVVMICFLVLFDFFSYVNNPHSSFAVTAFKKYYLSKVLENTKSFYKNYEMSLGTDEHILVMWLWPNIAKFMKHDFSQDPFYRIYANDLAVNDLYITRKVNTEQELLDLLNIFGDNVNIYDINDKYTNVMVDPFDNVLLKALYCDVSGYDDFDYKLLRKIRDDNGGYGDTHFLLALIFLEKLKCIELDKIAQDKEMVIEDIIEAETKSEIFNDIFAERLVFLFWANRRDDIKFDWIKKVAQSAQDGGSWKELGAEQSDPHITGLSALAIKYFIENKNVEDTLIK